MNTLVLLPPDVRALYVLAHGAGAGMRHPFLESLGQALVQRGIGTLRYQFPYMEEGRRRPDPPAVATERVRAAVQEAARQAPGVPLLAGGKSFGGRMTSTAQAESPLPGVVGLLFLGFPLHPPGKPGIERAAHLDAVELPMLFLQGTRDDFARLDLLQSVVARLEPRAAVHLVEGADHSFRVKGRGAEGVMAELVDQVARFADKLAAPV